MSAWAGAGATSQPAASYGAKDIQVLEGLEAVLLQLADQVIIAERMLLVLLVHNFLQLGGIFSVEGSPIEVDTPTHPVGVLHSPFDL